MSTPTECPECRTELKIKFRGKLGGPDTKTVAVCPNCPYREEFD